MVQVFRDVITDEDWARFQQYASRVRLLSIGDVSSVRASVWTILTRRCLDGALLPPLERLVGYAVDSIALCYAVLLSPTIQELHLRTDGAVDDGTVCMVLQAVQAVLSSIRHLHVQHIREQGRPSTVPFWSLAQLHTLKVTHRLILKDEMLCSLARFSHLCVLELHLEKVPTFVEDERVEGFASLREFTLTGSLTDMKCLLTTAAPPLLETLEVRVPDNSSVPYQSALVKLLAKVPKSLRCFSASFTTPLRNAFTWDATELLEPLKPFGCLRKIAFAFPYATKSVLSDANLSSFRNVWPELIEFEFAKPSPAKDAVDSEYVCYSPSRHGSAPPQENGPPPTLSTLAAFAHAHPHFRRLIVPALNLQPGAVPYLDSVPILDDELRHLGVGDISRGALLFNCALMLDLLFPRLDLTEVENTAAMSSADPGQDFSNTQGSADEVQLMLMLLGLQAGRVGLHRMRAAMLGGYTGDIPIPEDHRGKTTSGKEQLLDCSDARSHYINPGRRTLEYQLYEPGEIIVPSPPMDLTEMR
ncbi:hypothetical protein TRAPUB_9658 [Trametes pubescens]|uniref:F-box domain-containing protein n=1 Tax=Trametes pubescens TaxID=154538 RepID=A0A1M2W1R9_TRAPU|nr:hypothetical protein TRAPUB_9658 [Trametes pubescens]